MKTNSENASKAAVVAVCFEMFKWLGKHFNPDEITSVKFKPISHELLLTTGGLVTGGELVSIKFFDRDGQLLGMNQRCQEVRTLPFRKYLFWGERIETVRYGYQESVGQTITRIDPRMEKIHYVIGLRSKCPTDNRLYVSCPPKGMTFSRVLEEEREAAQKIILRTLLTLTS